MSYTLMMYNSPVGELYLVANADHLCGAVFGGMWSRFSDLYAEAEVGELPVLHETCAQLDAYFKGKRREFDLPLKMVGTPFQQAVWKQLRKIPYGSTCSYSTIAKRIKNNNAVRAVGSSNRRNPICIIVPCHRVITSDGRLGGYAGGLDHKLKLLQLEEAWPAGRESR